MVSLSIIIPVWNEAHKIIYDLENIQTFFKQASLDIEVIIADDGSTDNISEVINIFKRKSDFTIKLVTSSQHIGKGNAVKIGVNQGNGQFLCVLDSGSTIPLKHIKQAIKIINEEKLDFVWGSRHLAESKILRSRTKYRTLLSLLFRILIRIIFKFRYVTDTQCGFKIFKGNVARKIWNECKIDGFLFDIEILLIAKERDFKSREFPIEWKCDRDSRLSVVKILPSIIKQVRELRARFQ